MTEFIKDWYQKGYYMKTFVVMIDYGSEGWKIHAETDDFQEAVAKREEGLRNYNDTVIFRPVELTVTEKEVLNVEVSGCLPKNEKGSV